MKSKNLKHLTFSFIFAFAICAAGTAAWLWAQHIPGAEKYPFLLFFVCILLSAWYGGIGPGLLATASATCFAWYFFVPEKHSWRIASSGDLIALCIFIASGCIISGITEHLHRARERYRMQVIKTQEAEKQVRAQAEELSRSNQELEQFAYVSSHDLQEPLRTITNYVDLLVAKEDKLSPESKTYLGFIESGATRAQELIRDLLEYASITKKDYPFQSAELEAILAAAKTNLELAIKESGAVITHDPLPALEVNQWQITQLFQNLLSNAIKYRDGTQPRIHISARQEGDEWIISVKDNGIGINPQFKEHIFLIFKRLHSKTSYPGTGIGLAACKKIVEQHKGRIWVESEPGQGSTFFFSLPA